VLWLGAAIGAAAGLLIATLINVNCDSLLEQLDGCYRLDIRVALGVGAVFGGMIGWTRDRS
jgi:hypothetical protein